MPLLQLLSEIAQMASDLCPNTPELTSNDQELKGLASNHVNTVTANRSCLMFIQPFPPSDKGMPELGFKGLRPYS